MSDSCRACLARLVGLLCLTVCSSWFSSARAQDAPDAEGESWSPPRETEFSIVPFVGGSSDTGFGGGYIASLARLRPDREPYS